MAFVLGAFIVIVALVLAVQYWYISLLLVMAVAAPRIIRIIRMKRYFASPDFLKQKQEVASVIAEHNEVANYIEEIRNGEKFSLGHSTTGINSNLAISQNTSKYGYKRDKNVAELASPNVHNASLQIVRSAAAEPIKYFIKYFDIPATEEKLSEIEKLGESISRLENALENLKNRESSISTAIAPPKFILKYYLKEFRAQIGLSVPKIEIPYPEYKFQYVSAGGNSSQETKLRLDSTTIDSIIEMLSEKIKFAKSALGQRALMTANFRERIKSRDEYTCQICSISTRDEEHLLLEVDHIQPISKGGLSTESNLQTLCWKCNRTKSNKGDFPGA